VNNTLEGILKEMVVAEFRYYPEENYKKVSQDNWVMAEIQTEYLLYKIISQKPSTQQKCIFTCYMFQSHMDHHQAVQYIKYDSH
jgi:hypothetical protein